ncbi:hypothetical protein [Haloarchaeobius sp. DFWS5]|uniref:HVO_A0114 family putative DNA-binding protein n=1 Tax=Haloarchaeobius sp. DFWS5 TaxID=3446114 RepID=UPI003EBBD9E8
MRRDDEFPVDEASHDETDDGGSATGQTLKIRLESAEEFYARLGSGDNEALSVRSEEELGRLLAPSHLRMLRIIGDQHPTTIAAVADTEGRDPEEVERVLSVLAQYDLLTLAEHGDAVRPIPRYDELQIEVPL